MPEVYLQKVITTRDDIATKNPKVPHWQLTEDGCHFCSRYASLDARVFSNWLDAAIGSGSPYVFKPLAALGNFRRNTVLGPAAGRVVGLGVENYTEQLI
jgi:hypothetical protein